VGGAEESAAERPLDRLLRRSQQRNRKQRNRKQRNRRKDNKDQNTGPGQGRPLDCPDQHIECWTSAEGGPVCGDLQGTLGPLGMCWNIVTGCCPCDNDTPQHWAEECNETFPGCGGNCFAANENEFECLTLGTC
jgi:hypothetical protein